MRKSFLYLTIIVFGVIVAACSNDTENSDQSSDQANVETEQFTTENSQTSESPADRQASESSEEAASGQSEGDTTSEAKEMTDSDRKIIYTANLRIEVKDYQATVEGINAEVTDRGGYIVESNMREGNEDRTTTGQVTVRVPQEEFEVFVQTVEDSSNRVLESSTSGRDVTEEYVDLESRLESKQVVEERLQSFMEQAEKTEDLLEISDDLATVQQEIEEITGRMNYLDNKVDLATVTIYIEENNVSLSNEDDLNTWEKTKQQFMQSINFLRSAVSGLVVFLAGSSPVLLILALLGFAVFWLIRRRKKNEQ
ncbi:MYXO-CTERM domain-containing protein [Lentibacillus persicus]|uniref:MYXO-CTERM domain-containing protein n=1 Tax=Lentibacillus persicus TaxID=640948 RepID=A0A1I1X4Y6_9BACI|nr:DUF4349 domain-containing protein [Lentibacillus persicus]SFE02429.1 MYXO-CTERM domain-containing protein [Lentibacillus persicus]